MEALHTVGVLPPNDILLIFLMLCGAVASGTSNMDMDMRASAIGIVNATIMAFIVGSFAHVWYPLVIFACTISAGAGIFIAVLCSRNSVSFIAGSVNGAIAGLITSSMIITNGIISRALGETLVLWLIIVLVEYLSYWIGQSIRRYQNH